MSQYENPENLKLKNTFLIKITNRSDEKKMKFTKWVNAQNNAQNSFMTLIEHMIDRYGYEDITDHEIARKLYKEQLHFNGEEIVPENQQKTASKEVFHRSAAHNVDAPEEALKTDSKAPTKDVRIDPTAF
ncbi:MAG: hypothetical protein N2A99_02280 [Carnobacterium alterfunditum]